MTPDPWWQSALCAQTDSEIFFPTNADGSGGVRRAKRICARCPVRVQCAADTLPGEYGIRAGLTARERRVPGRKRGKDTKPRGRRVPSG